jgi:hypothetical protein
MNAADEDVARMEDEEPRRLRPSKERRRSYGPESGMGAVLLPWVRPLPNQPKVAPLGLDDVRKKFGDLAFTEDASTMAIARTQTLLRESTALWESRQERIRTWEGKAASLMGAVAVAVSLLTAGAALLLKPDTVSGFWRAALVIAFLLPLISLLMCGFLASRAVMKVFLVSRPQARQALKRAASAGPSWQADLDCAADLIVRAGENLYIADYKLAQVRAAYRWYQVSLVCFLVLGVVVALRAATM